MAAPGGSDGAAAQGEGAAEGQQDGQQQQQQQQPDIAQVLDKIGTQLEEQRQFLQTLPTADAGEQDGQEGQDPAEAQDEQVDLNFLDETAPGYQGPEAAMQQLLSTIDGIAEKKAQSLVGPLRNDIGELRTNAAIDDLVARYPQIGDPEVGKTVVSTAQEWARNAGHPELGTMPEFYELVYLAGRAAEQGQQEGASSEGSAATLEGAGGASPGGAAQGDGPTTESVTASWREQRHPLFSGGR